MVFHGRDGAARSSVRKEIELAGGGAMRVSGEVKSFSDIEAARLQIEGELGLVDIFVANLGGSFTPPRPSSRHEQTRMARVYRRKPHGDFPYN